LLSKFRSKEDKAPSLEEIYKRLGLKEMIAMDSLSRIILDTIIWISYLISKRLIKLDL